MSEENPFGLLAQARRLLLRRAGFDEPLGRVLRKVEALELWYWLGYESFGEYCRERLGVSVSTARQRILLEKRMTALPPLRKALREGRITYTKAIVVARHATLRDVEERIAAAESTTWQKVKEGADSESDRKDRKRGVRRESGTAKARELVLSAIEDARRQFLALGEEISEGEAAARTADHFVKVYEIPLKRADWRTKWKKKVLLRHGGLCAVPGCTRAARDIHHIVFRRLGGPDVDWNCIALCWFHHKRCVHRGLLDVRGRGGEFVIFRFRDRSYATWARYEIRGKDRLRKLVA